MATNWAENVLGRCMRLRRGESVLILTDEPLGYAREALSAAARAFAAGEVAVAVLPGSQTGPLTLVSNRFLKQVQQADVIVSLLSSLDLSGEHAFLRAAVAAFRQAGRGRWGFGAYIDADVLQHELCADYREVARIAGNLAARLAGVDNLRITSAAGSDLCLRIGGRPIHQDTGILTEPRSFGNLPAGEVYVAPLEDSAEGRLVVDLSVGDLLLSAPVTLTFERGRVVSAEGGASARELVRRLGDDPWAWTVGEFGIGANPNARVRGRVTTDEKVLGTLHVALGANREFGGRNPAATHYDCVIGNPVLQADGREIRLK